MTTLLFQELSSLTLILSDPLSLTLISPNLLFSTLISPDPSSLILTSDLSHLKKISILPKYFKEKVILYAFISTFNISIIDEFI